MADEDVNITINDDDDAQDQQSTAPAAEQGQAASDPGLAQEASHPSNTDGVTAGANPGNPTPVESGTEADRAVPIDPSGIGTRTNQDVIDNLPKTDGQVVITDSGVQGLPADQQPLPSAVTAPQPADSAATDSSQ